MARPTKLDAEVTARLVQLLRGIAPRTFFEWLARGEGRGRGDAPYRDLREAVERARCR
jgi:hypothetical protein